MFSIVQAKSKLPVEFILNLYNQFSEKNADKILNGMCQRRVTTLRANNIKCSSEELEKYFDENKIEYSKLDWYDDAFIIENATEKELQKLDLYKKGYFYLQSISSMLPPLVLEPKEGEVVLDLTAAPGSKTTQIASLMNNNGKIIANEIDRIRCDRLKYNVSIQGADIVEVINEDGQFIGDKYFDQFDKVLIDTPCSGEGRFLLSDSKSYSSWSEKLVRELINLQKKLLESAVKATKQGGIIVYSTCTLNLEENERIIDWAIKNLNVEVLDIDLKIKKSIKGNSKGLDKSIEKTIKIFPNEKMEGFYVAKLRKK